MSSILRSPSREKLESHIKGNVRLYCTHESFRKNGKSKQYFKFLCGTPEDIWNREIKAQGQDRLHEVIVRDRGCHLHLDIDYNDASCLEKGKYVHAQWNILKPELHKCLSYFVPSGTAIDFLVYESSYEKKGSLHVIVDIAGYVFANNGHCGQFLLNFMTWIDGTKTVCINLRPVRSVRNCCVRRSSAWILVSTPLGATYVC
jgi:hypothetical protein